jgi:hypothetical protein
MANIVKCKGCGMPIFFEGGIPYYAKAVPVMLITAPDGIELKTRGYVSHFVNCPKAKEFSQDKKGGIG